MGGCCLQRPILRRRLDWEGEGMVEDGDFGGYCMCVAYLFEVAFNVDADGEVRMQTTS